MIKEAEESLEERDMKRKTEGTVGKRRTKMRKLEKLEGWGDNSNNSSLEEEEPVHGVETEVVMQKE